MREKSAEVLFIPKFMLIPLFISITWNSITYFGSRLLTTNWHHINAEISLDSCTLDGVYIFKLLYILAG